MTAVHLLFGSYFSSGSCFTSAALASAHVLLLRRPAIAARVSALFYRDDDASRGLFSLLRGCPAMPLRHEPATLAFDIAFGR